MDRVANAYINYLSNRYETRVFNFQYSNTLFKNLEEQAFLLNSRSNDIIIHPTNSGPLRKMTGKEIYVLHDTAYLDYPDGFSKLFVKWYSYMIPRLLSSKDLILTVSEFSKNSIIEKFNIPDSKIEVVRNGIPKVYETDFNNYQPQHFLCVGSFSSRKASSVAIKAHRLLPKEIRRQYPLVMVGSFNSYFNEEGVKSLIDDHIVLKGFVEEPELHDLYLNSVALISTSRFEGFGLPLVESFARGKHVICTDINPHVEILGENYHYFFKKDNIDELKSLMEKTILDLDNLFFNAETIHNRYLIANKFLWSKTLTKLDDVIKKLSSNGH